jgi:hypothetical protein
MTSLRIGPSGRLPVPMLRAGRTLIVGVDERTYTEVLG